MILSIKVEDVDRQHAKTTMQGRVRQARREHSAFVRCALAPRTTDVLCMVRGRRRQEVGLMQSPSKTVIINGHPVRPTWATARRGNRQQHRPQDRGVMARDPSSKPHQAIPVIIQHHRWRLFGKVHQRIPSPRRPRRGLLSKLVLAISVIIKLRRWRLSCGCKRRPLHRDPRHGRCHSRASRCTARNLPRRLQMPIQERLRRANVGSPRASACLSKPSLHRRENSSLHHQRHTSDMRSQARRRMIPDRRIVHLSRARRHRDGTLHNLRATRIILGLRHKLQTGVQNLPELVSMPCRRCSAIISALQKKFTVDRVNHRRLKHRGRAAELNFKESRSRKASTKHRQRNHTTGHKSKRMRQRGGRQTETRVTGTQPHRRPIGIHHLLHPAV